MPVGRPISLTPNIATKTLSSTATADQTSFTVTGGYRINELGVYRNGVRLVQGKDFTASDGSTVTLLSGAVADDTIDFVIFDSFNIADAITTVGNQTIDGEITATKFIGDGSELTGVGTDNINTNNIKVSGISTFGSGASTFPGAVSITDSTASTSTTTGALKVTGGVGIAGSLHVGENVSVGGTLTYEDVTNIDSVGLITARLGVIVDGGRGLQVTAGGLNVTAGVATFTNNVTTLADFYLTSSGIGGTNVSWDASVHKLIFKDEARAVLGTGEDLVIYSDGTNGILEGGGSGANAPILINGNTVRLQTQTGGEKYIDCQENDAVELYFNGNKKFETSNDGTVTTGIATASDFVIGAGGTSVHTALGTKASTGKAIAMAMIFG